MLHGTIQLLFFAAILLGFQFQPLGSPTLKSQRKLLFAMIPVPFYEDEGTKICTQYKVFK
jgi:hypothetical protein